MKKFRVIFSLALLVLISGCFGPTNDKEAYEAWATKITDKREQLVYPDPSKIKKEEKKFKENLESYKKIIEEGNNIELTDELKEQHKTKVYQLLKDDSLELAKIYKYRDFKNNKDITKFNNAVDKINKNRITIPNEINKIIDEMYK
ncbi:MAG: hypothetical protein RR543_00685 [Erysipelotrichales bacterium]